MNEAQLIDKTSKKQNAVELFMVLGLMLDIEQNVHLYHSWRVSLVANALAEKYAPHEAPLVFLAGLMSDVAGVRFRRHIVHELIDKASIGAQKASVNLFFHPIVGYELLRRIPGFRNVGELVLAHHECINGTGYPKGLKGNEIGLGAQILKIADMLDLIIRADKPESLDDVKLALRPFVHEDFSEKLMNALLRLLDEELPFGALLQPEKISNEMERLGKRLYGLKLFDGEDEWEMGMKAIGEIIDARNDLFSRGHAARTAELAEKIALAHGLSENQRRVTRWAAYLQNMGEVSLRRHVLSKEGRLEKVERQMIRMHPALSYDLLSRVSGFHEIATAIRAHHENWDGSGYPDGLMEQEIPMSARIIRVADSFCAMTSDRPYQRKKARKQALKELKRQSENFYDPRIVSIALEIAP